MTHNHMITLVVVLAAIWFIGLLVEQCRRDERNH